MAKKLWGGRFRKPTDPRFETFSASFQWDKRLLPYDLRIDAAHVKALRGCGVLSAAESTRLLSAIRDLGSRAARGRLVLDASSEDVHSAVHQALKKLAGNVADKLHTGRSRNDLVSQSSRLYCKDHAQRLCRYLSELQAAVVRAAERHEKVRVTGMTHLQNAQVLSQAHIFLSYAEMLERSKRHFELAAELADVCVLGSGALAGSTFALDQALMARELGLSRITANSYDVSGDRDFVYGMLSACHLAGTHLSRIAEDLMISQTKGFSLVDIDQSLCTGSSMMPQKKNADFVELVRGAAGVFFANLTGFSTTLKGLPTSYNRDLQWDKKYLFDSVETLTAVLPILTTLFETLKVNSDRAAASLKDESLYATDLADHLTAKGVPFREAHELAGKIVAFSEEKGVPISGIGLDLLRQFAPQLDGSVYSLFDPEHSVRMKRTVGSTHPAQVRRRLGEWKSKLKRRAR